jgi:hypothetical protein
MDDLVGISLMKDDEVLLHYDRSLLDMVWLEKMVEQCTPKSSACAHYEKQLRRERGRLDRLEGQMVERQLIQ